MKRMVKSDWNKTCDLIASATNILVGTHEDPDGDALGSALALMHGLRSIGKRVRVYCPDQIPIIFKTLPGIEELHREMVIEEDEGLIVVVDSADFERAPISRLSSAGDRTIINIDHHAGNSMFGETNIVDTTASACAVLVAELLETMGIALEGKQGECVYAGIMVDTGRFGFLNTDQRTFETCARVAACGVSCGTVAGKIYRNRDPRALRLLGLVLSKLELWQEGKVSVLTVTVEDCKRAGVRSEEVIGLADYAKTAKGSMVAVLFREADDGTVRVSLRSEGFPDVRDIATQLGGGGHASAAGCVLSGTLDEARSKVGNILSKSFEGRT
jgi:phosphoesterase RecJ-like protein